MTNAVYIAAGYVATAGTIASYAWSIRTRIRRVERVLPVGPMVPAATRDPETSAPGTEREG
jgi:hypothetical protein